MQVQGVVISVSTNTKVKKNGGGTYDAWELVYKSLDGEVRTIAKPVQGLKFNAALKTQLEGLTTGDEFTLEQEKNQAGFYDVKTITKGLSGGLVATPEKQPAQRVQSTPYQASSYPTADERNKTQNHIIRQSSLAQANATLAIAGKAVKPEDVIKVAEQYVAWVKDEKTGHAAIDDMSDDIPS